MNKSLLNIIAKKFGKDPGKMLIHTGVIGWGMSAAAQICAIVFNDKLKPEQKMFMIPQEFADAMVNIVSFYVITRGFSTLGATFVRTGRLIPKNISNYIKKIGFGKQIGKIDFNINKHVKMPKNIKAEYNDFKKGIEVSSTIIGSILSCNIITPIVRNLYASKRQEQNIAKLNIKKNTQKANIASYTNYIYPTMQTFQNNASLKI
ncbi:hypothetical protein J6G99_02200 [bacterium]|nr:hypothetical protein [bacterium]